MHLLLLVLGLARDTGPKSIENCTYLPAHGFYSIICQNAYNTRSGSLVPYRIKAKSISKKSWDLYHSNEVLLEFPALS